MAEPDEQCIERILRKLGEVRHKGLKCFGSETHNFRLNPPLNESAIAEFEAIHKIVLPPDFRSFLRLAGNGGAGPYYGIYRLEDSSDFVDLTTDERPEFPLALPCPLTPKMARDAGWAKQFSDCISPCQGVMSIGRQGCSYVVGLIITGEHAGRVVYLDEDDEPPYVVREPDFLSWYERWLDELLGGYDMFWFGFGLGGDERALLALLRDQTTSDADRVDAVYAIRRLPNLSNEAREEILGLLTDSVAGVRAAACHVSEKFGILEASKLLPDLLRDLSADVQKAAITLAMKAGPAAFRQDVLQLLRSDDIEVAKHAFFTLQRHEKIPREVLLPLVQSSPHARLRVLAAHALPWQPEDKELLNRLLKDEEPQVRHYADLGLRQIRSAWSSTGWPKWLPFSWRKK